MTLREEFAAARQLITAMVLERIADRLEAIEKRLSMSQPRVVITGSLPGQTPIPKGGRGPSREGLMILDVGARRLLICGEGRWWQAALKPATPFDDIDPALAAAITQVAAMDAEDEEDAPA